MAHGLVHFAAVTKAHFDLGGVHVHVHTRGVHVQVQRIDGLALAVQHVFIGAAGGVGEHLVAHKAAVHIAKLLVGPGAGGVGNAHAPPHPHLAARSARTIGPLAGAAPVHGNGSRQKVGTQHVGQAPVQRGELLRAQGGAGFGVVLQRRKVQVGAAGAPLLDHFAFVPDGKTYVRAGQGVAAYRFDAMRQLGGVGFEKFAARRGAVKQLFDLNRGALGARHRAQFAGAAIEQKGLGLAAGARQNGAVGNRIDGGQRLAAKAHGGHRLQVVQIADLAGGMALKSNRQLARQDAHAVVFHGNQAYAAGKQAHRHLACAGVQRVVHQFAHHRCGPLHHFACGNLADQRVGQFTDGAAGGQGGGVHRVILGRAPTANRARAAPQR